MKIIKLILLTLFSMIMVSSMFFLRCKGPIKKEEVNQPQVTNKIIQREQPKLVYDANGNITERHAYSYRSDNTIRSQDSYYYKFDDRNNLVEETKESYTPDGTLDYKNVNLYTYNDLNLKTEQKFFSYDKDNQLQRQARNTYVYNSKGELIEEKTYFENGKVKSIINSERNDNGELKSEEYIYFDEEGKKTDHKKYHYSKFGLERTEDFMKK